MVYLKNLEKLLQSRGNKTKLSKNLGISTGNISDWFNPAKKSSPSAEALIRMANYFGCSVDYLLDRTNANETPHDDNVIYLPVLEQRVSAGLGIEVNDTSDIEYQMTYFSSLSIPNRATHGIIINGHSMEPKFFHNQIVFIEQGAECAVDEYGIFVVTKNSGNPEVYCKQKKINNDGLYFLHSINSEYPDIELNPKDTLSCRCVGKILK